MRPSPNYVKWPATCGFVQPGVDFITSAQLLQSGSMASYTAGLLAQKAMLIELLRRERERLDPPSKRELAAVTGRSYKRGRIQVEAMEGAGLVSIKGGIGRHGAQVTLTDCGRVAARIASLPGPSQEMGAT